jgi:TonB family protein
MPLRLSLRVFIFGLLIGATAFTAGAQAHPSALEEAPAYPESADGLKQLIQDIFSAMRAKDNAKLSSLFASMTLPDLAAWFTQTFGPTEGARVDTEYTNLLPSSQINVRDIFEHALKEGRTEIQVAVVNKGNRTSEREQRVVDAMQAPVPLYVVIGSGAKAPSATMLGHFFYAYGGFRFLTAFVLQNIGVSRPKRILVSGNIQQGLLIQRIEPKRPATKTKGTVLLRVIVATDGSVSEVSVISGDPDLAQAAMDAVRQWRYKPTTLNGTPMIVETAVSIEFKR